MKWAHERPSDVAEMIMNILECNISQTGLAHFHVSTVLTLKMHKNGLVFYGLFFYSVRKLGSFDILLVFFSTVCF